MTKEYLESATSKLERIGILESQLICLTKPDMADDFRIWEPQIWAVVGELAIDECSRLLAEARADFERA